MMHIALPLKLSVFLIFGRGLLCLAMSAASPQTGEPDLSAAPPVGLERLVVAMRDIKAKRVLFNEKIVIDQIRRGGISFAPTIDALQRLAEAGAGPALLAAVRAARRAGVTSPEVSSKPTIPVVPTTVKPVATKQGLLAVVCKPVDCDVLVNGKLVDRTLDGGARELSLDEGLATVSVRRSGYDVEPAERKVTVRQRAPSLIEFTLTPSDAKFRVAGRRLYDRMMVALGGEDAWKEISVIHVKGEITVTEFSFAKPEVWPFTAMMKPPDKAQFTLHRKNRTYETGKTGGRFSWTSRPKGGSSVALEEAIKLFEGYSYFRLLHYLHQPDTILFADKVDPVAVEDLTFQATNRGNVVLIFLGPDYRPLAISLVQQRTVRLRIYFGDYDSSERIAYPRRFTSVPAAGRQSVVRLQEIRSRSEVSVQR